MRNIHCQDTAFDRVCPDSGTASCIQDISQSGLSATGVVSICPMMKGNPGVRKTGSFHRDPDVIQESRQKNQ
jgi:hypothetical protein